jgi:AcrR family transcriptional regulator
MAKEKQTIRDKAADALLALVAEQGWEKSTLNLVAERAGLSLADLVADSQNRFDLLDHFGQRTNQRAIKIAEEEGGSEAVRDKLFAMLMARFDVLADHKAAIMSLSKSAQRDPGLALYFAHKIRSTMSLFLEAAGVNTATAQGRIKASGLALLYGKVVRTWFKDDSEDLAKTMKALDAALADAERWGKRLNGNWKDIDMKFWKRRPKTDDAVQAA